jgi:hypothetical protein
MLELNDFYNNGFGWICRHCERDLTPRDQAQQKHSRIFQEGEAESKNPELSNLALAKWTDKTRRFLMCPRCHVTELVDNS